MRKRNILGIFVGLFIGVGYSLRNEPIYLINLKIFTSVYYAQHIPS